MAGSVEQGSKTRETASRFLEFTGIIGGIIGLAALNLEVVVFSLAAYGGGKLLEKKKN